MLQGKHDFVEVGNIVLYLSKLTYVSFFPYGISQTTCQGLDTENMELDDTCQLTCQGLDTENMELDETCQLTCFPSKLALTNFKLNSK